ncbi:DUF167 domain-containing protein [Desulfuromonas sp. AOP6]|uniref:DUF167 domain-containing protein n=1 Tax=Desulfuromonas sp. AOP6 TaxID=1566351 RepID=UPI00128AACC0|nr:DUF167 domain-containing protein [Desulfuromonas sp. AOP6]BCA78957.1 UPF0235 protein [Desulfuromonas sp. AOP6]
MFAFLHGAPGGVTIDLWVQPRASRNEIVGPQGEELKVKLTSPPVEGAANRLCCEFFAKTFGVPKGCVRLVGGEKSRHKRLLIEGVRRADVEDVLRNLF